MESDTRLLSQLVDKVTEKRNLDCDADALRRLKRICKSGGTEAVRTVHYLLFESLKNNHARVRLHAVTVADELFRRSSAFRVLTAENFSEFLELTVGFRAAKPLPPPQQDAVQLREKTLESIDQWNEEWGSSYPQISMGCKYLKEVVKMKFPELRAAQAAREAEANARLERTRQLTAEKYESIKREYVAVIADIDVVVDEMEASFRLLEGRPEPLPDAAADDEWEDVDTPGATLTSPESGEAGRAAEASGALKSPPPVLCNPDPAVIDAVRGAYKSLTNRYLPTVSEWLRVFMRVEVGTPGTPEHRRRERILRTAIRVRDRMTHAQRRCEALMKAARDSALQGGQAGQALLVINAVTDADGKPKQATAVSASREGSARSPPPASRRRQAVLIADVFGSDSEEEAAAVSAPARRGSSQSLTSSGRAKGSAQALSPQKHFDPTYRRQPPPAAATAGCDVLKEDLVLAAEAQSKPPETSAAPPAKSSLPEEVKRRLLAEAPAIPGGTHLAYWDSDKASLMNSRGMEVYNHWGAVDAQAELPDHVVSQFFTTRATYYQPSAKDAVAQPPAAKKRSAERGDESPPRKRQAPVTAIGFGGVTNSRNLATFVKRRPQPPALHESASSLPQPSEAATEQVAGRGPPQAGNSVATNFHGGQAAVPQPEVDRKGTGTQSAQLESSISAEGQRRGRQGRAAAGAPTASREAAAAGDGGSGGRKERLARQRAADRAHNEAVLGELGGDDEALARNLAEHELQALGGGRGAGRGAKRKERPPVRQRLAQKLLTGNATLRAIQDLDSVENEKFKEMESRRW